MQAPLGGEHLFLSLTQNIEEYLVAKVEAGLVVAGAGVVGLGLHAQLVQKELICLLALNFNSIPEFIIL